MTTRGAKRPSSPAASDGSPVGKAGFVFPGLILGAKRRHCESAAGSADSSRFQEWTALYTTQLTQKEKKYHDGAVRLVQAGPHLKKILLLGEEGQVIGSRHLKPGESIESGKKSHVPNYLVEICEARNEKKGVECSTLEEPVVHTGPNSGENTSNKMGLSAMSRSQKFISPQNVHDLETESDDAASSGKPGTGKVEVMAAGSSGSLMGTYSGFTEWKALYTTQLTQKAKKYHDGIIRLRHVGSHARQIVLLDEESQELRRRYLEAGESVESGKICRITNYIIKVCELRNQNNEAEQSLGEGLNQTGPRNEDNTSDKTGAKSKSSKFVSPFKSQDVRKGNWENTTSSSRPQIGKTTCSSMDGSLNFDALSDLRGKSDIDINERAGHGKSMLGTMDDPLKFNDFQRGTSTNSIWPEVGKSNSSSVGDPLQFHDPQDGRSGRRTSSTRREVGKSTIGNTGDSLRTGTK